MGVASDSNIDLGGFVSNLIPVTLGNIVGGAVFVAAMYWLAYLRPSTRGLVSDAAMQEDHS
jgi:formate/nitrite transporter FocA (FNT family)